jgi:hypothetical protein
MSDSPRHLVVFGAFCFHPPPRKGITMAIQLEANYSKKLGLPGYSSHQFSVTIRVELADIKQVEAESSRLYALLQGCVDRDIQQTGFLPVPGTNGSNGNGHNNGQGVDSNVRRLIGAQASQELTSVAEPCRARWRCRP